MVGHWTSNPVMRIRIPSLAPLETDTLICYNKGCRRGNVKNIIEKIDKKKIENIEQEVPQDNGTAYDLGYNKALDEIINMIKRDYISIKDFETKQFKDILKEYHDPYKYIAILVKADKIRTIEDYLENGVRRGDGYFAVENQGVKSGNEQPVIYKFIDRFKGSRRIAKLLTQKEYDDLLLDANERKMVKELKDRG